MKTLTRVSAVAWLLLALAAQAQTLPVEIRQGTTRYNLQSKHGVPISSTTNSPPGSTGHPNLNDQNAWGGTVIPATAKQFQSFVAFGGVVVPQRPLNLNSNLNIGRTNALSLGLPVGRSNTVVVLVLKSAQVGGPFLSRRVSYLFGGIVQVPATDESGHLLTGIRPEDYWIAEPFTTNNHATDSYYWSPHAQTVFAVQPGPLAITWQKSTPYATKPADYDANPQNYYLVSGSYYPLYTVRYVVSGSPVKTPRQIYWTEGVFRSLGKPVLVPKGRVGAVNIVYNNNFPERVDQEYSAIGESHVVDTNRLEETRTLWYDQQQGAILAYNQEGRVFVEFLGDTKPDGVSRVHLGFEIVDVSQQANPVDVTIELGERLTAWQDGRDDSALAPEPVTQSSGNSFVFQHTVQGRDRSDYYATRETQNLNDYMVHWTQAGELGLRWPYLFVRYQFIWPDDPAAYSHYVRPTAADETEARQTAVLLPMDNVPVIEYEDPTDRTRSFLTESFLFYTFLDANVPALRTLVRYSAGTEVAFERIFSWHGPTLKGGSFADTVATNLSAWNPTNQTLVWSSAMTAPRVVNQTVEVGQRLSAPAGEAGAGGGSDYLAGHLRVDQGDSYYPAAYVDPFVAGFEAANASAIIPVNAIPGRNLLEVWWFRPNGADLTKGFKTVYWPAVIGRYTIQWPAHPREIILASNAGSGGLASLEAKGRIYYQNDPTQPGYNPNEEHALMLAGQAYALRDDLNITSGANYSSDPFVLLAYTEADSRPAMSVFKVSREKPEAGILFDYITEAGQILQVPMPLPLLPKPVEGSGTTAVNYNQEPSAASGDWPINWSEATYGSGPYALYKRFTYKDRKDNYWVYRGLHADSPALQIGSYDSTLKTFGTLSNATAVVGQPFSYTLHASRRTESLVLTPPADLPDWVNVNGLTLSGTPGTTDIDTNTVSLIVTAPEDGRSVTNNLRLAVIGTGTVVGQAALAIVSTNSYAGTNVTYVGRPPYLAASPAPSNSFTMRFYYKTQDGFAWPGNASPPAVGSIVPYLRPKDGSGNFVGDPASKTTSALSIVYRPVWPYADDKLGRLKYGDTLTVPKHNLPAVRGQTSLQILYQQSIATNIAIASVSAVLHDPTREKTYDITLQTLDRLPGGVRTDSYQGKQYFPALPPYLARRLFFDPNRGSKGCLVLRGEFKDEPVGEKYLLLNVLRGTELAAAKALCSSDDPDKAKWDAAVDGLSTTVQTFKEDPPGTGNYVPDTTLDRAVGVDDLAEVTDDETAVDSYGLSATGPGGGYVTLIAGNGRAFTPPGEPVSMYIIRVLGPMVPGELKVIPSDNPLNEMLTLQHSPDLAGRFGEFEYQWKIAPPVDGMPPLVTPAMTDWTDLASGTELPRYTLGGAGVQVLADNYLVLRYRPVNPAHPLYHQWSDWTEPQLAEGWIKRVLAGINPFNQRVTDLFNNQVNTDVSMLTQAGHRWEGNVALNLANINNYGLIEIYETVLRRGRMLSIDAGINYGPANDALLLAAGYLNDLYVMVGNEAWADAANPTIGIGTKDRIYGDIATALFAFKGQVPSLLEEELALIRGRDDFLQPGVQTPPVYNRLFWNYTRGIDAGEVIYALNYNILDQNADGVVNAADAASMFPQGHGDAYGHYLTALKGYYSLLMNLSFDWVPRTEAVTVLGKAVQVDYMDERKFAAAAAGVARAGRQVFDLTWRRDYQSGSNLGWQQFGQTAVNTRRTLPSTRYWGLDHWAARTGIGAYVNWVVGNAILPAVDPDPAHEGIQKIDRTTVPELQELPALAGDLQTGLDNAEAGLTPLGLPQNGIAFDLNPTFLAGWMNQTHFEQIYERAKAALNNAVGAFDDAKDVTRLMRSEQDSLADLQAEIRQQETAYENSLIEIYGTPYPDDVGPGKTYAQGYGGPDLLHYMYVDLPELHFPELWNYTEATNFWLDIQDFPSDFTTKFYTNFDFAVKGDSPDYTEGTHYIQYKIVPYQIGAHGLFEKPALWTGKRYSPGSIQQAISEYLLAQNNLKLALAAESGGKSDLDRAIRLFESSVAVQTNVAQLNNQNLDLAQEAQNLQSTYDVLSKDLGTAMNVADMIKDAAVQDLPESSIFGVAFGGDTMFPARAVIAGLYIASKLAMFTTDAARFRITQGSIRDKQAEILQLTKNIAALQLDQALKEQVFQLENQMGDVQAGLDTINTRLRELDDAGRKIRGLLAQGDRIQSERETYRQRSAAIVQGFRTRDAAFRVFRNEKLERYKTLFDLAARYAFLAAQAYDYETGLLNTDAGRDFISRIARSRALGVVRGGEPQYAGSDTGDPGLSSALAEMKADWDVLKGRLGFNNPDTYGTTVSLRTENFRILPGSDGNEGWQDVLHRARMDDVLQDDDVRRRCMQIDAGDGLPVPGLVLEFTTTIADGYNFFGRQLAAGDHAFSPSSFATKIFALGVALEGYIGMDDPSANSSAVAAGGGVSPSEPSVSFLDPMGLSANPYVYLVPVGVDSMRSPPLGDSSVVRTWNVAEVCVPVPFNIGASDFSTKALWQSGQSLTEELFSIRKHQAFRPVGSAAVFTGDFAASQYTNQRLIGRSVWNSKWKLVIPGRTLLNDPKEGLDRFIQTVRDIKLHLVTYSYAGN